MSKAEATATKTVDSRGRLTLGEAYANRTVIVEQRGDGEFLVRMARVIPEQETWLYENADALNAVRRGLKEARAGKVSRKGPDRASARKLADKLEDN
jgi:hypothetical protein